jgi:hypothetical protein
MRQLYYRIFREREGRCTRATPIVTVAVAVATGRRRWRRSSTNNNSNTKQVHTSKRSVFETRTILPMNWTLCQCLCQKLMYTFCLRPAASSGARLCDIHSNLSRTTLAVSSTTARPLSVNWKYVWSFFDTHLQTSFSRVVNRARIIAINRPRLLYNNRPSCSARLFGYTITDIICTSEHNRA